MAKKAYEHWSPLPHSHLIQLAKNLWWVQGSLPKLSLKRCMVVVKLSSGDLLLHNVIALEEAAMAQLEALGRPAVMVVPGGMHRLDAPVYKKRYPHLKVYAPKGARAQVEEVVAVDGAFEDFPEDAAARLEALNGVGDKEGVLMVHSEDGKTVVLNDAVFNMDKKKGFWGRIFTLIGSAPGPRVSRLGKMLLVKDRKALRQELLRLAELKDLRRLIVAHEKVSHGEEAAQALRRASTYL